MRAIRFVPLVLASACGGAESADGTDATTTPPVEFVVVADDFRCLLDLPLVRHMRVDNLLGDVAGTQAAAEAGAGGLPPGSVVQLFTGEAMVKHLPGWNAESGDWEFFNLAVDATGTEITAQGGGADVANLAGSCLGCHAAAVDFDYLCETGHGCDPLDFTEEQITALQNIDPRCP